MPEQDPARRAVVTGLGAVMPIGNDFPTYWSNLVAGVTGTRTVKRFDASAFEVDRDGSDSQNRSTFRSALPFNCCKQSIPDWSF